MKYILVLLGIAYSSNLYSNICGVKDLECLAPIFVPHYSSDSKSPDFPREWSAYRGKAFAFDDRILVSMRFNEESLDILSSRDFGFEIDLVLKGENKNIALDRVESTFPSGAKSGLDTAVFDRLTNGDTNRTIGMHVLNPTALEADTDYHSIFIFDKELPSDGVEVLTVNLQLTIDIDYGPFFSSLIVDQIRVLDQFQYYALETDYHQLKGTGTGFIAHPNSTEAICWSDIKTSYACYVGPMCVGSTFDLLKLIGIRSARADVCARPFSGDIVPIRAEFSGPRGEGINPENPGHDNSGSGDPNLSINSFQLAFGSKSNQSHYQRKLIANPLPPGGCTYFHGKVSFRNKGGGKSKDIDVDYRVDDGRNFRTNDKKVDEDTESSLDAGEEVTRHMGTAKVCASYDGSLLHVYDTIGTHLEDYPVGINGRTDIFYFVDIEDEDGDDDISSDHSDDGEYGKLEVTVAGNPLVWELGLSQMESGSTRVGDTWTLRYTISNDIPWHVPEPIVVDYYLDDQFFKSVTLPALVDNEDRLVEISGSETTPGDKSLKACLSISRNHFPLANPGACTPAGTLTVNHRPQAPFGHITGHNCSVITGKVQDPNGTKSLWIHVYDEGGIIGHTRANASGNFRYTFPQSQMDAKSERIRVYALDDRVAGYAGNPVIGSFTRGPCYPSGTVDVRRATNLRSQSYYHIPNHDSLAGNGEWRREGVTFRAYPTSSRAPNTRLIYFNWSHSRRSHVPSHSPNEGVGGGYSRGHATFRCSTRSLPGMRPLWRMYSSRTNAHRLAQDAGVIRGSERSGFRKEAVMCYVWPVKQN